MKATQSFVIDFIHGVYYFPCQLIELFHLTVEIIRSGFALLPHSIGEKYSRHLVNQSEVKLSFEWFDGLPSSFVIGQNDYNQQYPDHVIRAYVVAVPPTT